jgi:exodeoxyribonuclease-3
MKIACWNVNSFKVRLPHVLDWLAANQVDVLCLQETKTEDKGFPFAELSAAGYTPCTTGRRPITASRSCRAPRPRTCASTFPALPTSRSA